MTITVAYDPTGLSPANLISNEVHSPIVEPDIFPLQGCFYEMGFIITGVEAATGVSRPLALFTDYVFSPLFSERSADTGKEVYTYVLLNDYVQWASITITYQAVGGDQDSVLLGQILMAGNFDRTNVENWLAFEGDITSFNADGVDMNLKSASIAYLFAGKLDAIAMALRTPSSFINFINTQFATMQQNVAALEALTSSWNAAFTNAGLFNGSYSSGGSLTPLATPGGVGSYQIYSNTSGNQYGGSWQPMGICALGNMLPHGMARHTSSTLSDGRLIMMGGSDGYVTLTSVYLGTVSGESVSWVPSTPLPQPLEGHTATVLNDGRILVTGGNAVGVASEAVTYIGTVNGNSISWVASTALPQALNGHRAKLLSDGRVVITGGIATSGATVNTVYIGTISGNAISWVTSNPLLAALWGHTLTVLADGRLLVTGGYVTTVTPTTVTYGQNATYIGTILGNGIAWVAGSNLPTTLTRHTASLLADGRVLIAGGVNDNSATSNNTVAIQSATYLGTISGNTITWINGTNLPQAIMRHAVATLADGRIIFNGGWLDVNAATASYITDLASVSANAISYFSNNVQTLTLALRVA